MKHLLETKPSAYALGFENPVKCIAHIFQSIKLQWTIREQEIRMKKRKKKWMKKLGS